MYQDKRILNMTREDYAKGRMPVDIFQDVNDVFVNIAETIAEEIRSANGKKRVFILPLGPVGQYEYLAEIINREQLSLKNITIINMDEYMWDENTVVEVENPLSFENQMYRFFYDKVDQHLLMEKSQRIFPTPSNGEYIRGVIEGNGGVDLCVGGIGINGHVAFNEPPEEGMTDEDFQNLSVRVINIAKETIVTNSLYEFDGAFEFMPNYAVTIGFNEIMQSKKIRLYVFKPFHKMVVRKACFYKKSCEFPVTLLEGLDVRIGMNQDLV